MSLKCRTQQIPLVGGEHDGTTIALASVAIGNLDTVPRLVVLSGTAYRWASRINDDDDTYDLLLLSSEYLTPEGFEMFSDDSDTDPTLDSESDES